MREILYIVIVLLVLGALLGYTPYGAAWPRLASPGLGGIVFVLIILMLLGVI